MHNTHDDAYHSHYCEENIYKLAFKYKNLYSEAEDYDSYVVFISNDAKQTPLWEQKLAPVEGQPVLWDYHVVYLIRSEEGASVIDLDTNLGYRVPFSEYVKKTFRPEVPLSDQKHTQFFRVVPANAFLEHFASDRSHMIDYGYGGKNGGRSRSTDSAASGDNNRRRSESTDQYRQRAKSIVYTQPPPPWPPIYGAKAETDMNVPSYVSMEPELDEKAFGKVMNLKEFITFGNLTC